MRAESEDTARCEGHVGQLGGSLSQADLPTPSQQSWVWMGPKAGQCSETSSGECPLWQLSPSGAKRSLPSSASRSPGRSVRLEMQSGTEPCPPTLPAFCSQPSGLSRGACGQAGLLTVLFSRSVVDQDSCAPAFLRLLSTPVPTTAPLGLLMSGLDLVPPNSSGLDQKTALIG